MVLAPDSLEIVIKLIKTPSKELQLYLAKLETILVSQYRPVFLAIMSPDENGDIQIIISCIQFNYLTIQERINHIFNLLNDKIPDIVKDRLILIQAFSTEQMEDVLLEVFDGN